MDTKSKDGKNSGQVAGRDAATCSPALAARICDARRRISALAAGRQMTLHVPANPDDDDLFICAVLDECRERLCPENDQAQRQPGEET